MNTSALHFQVLTAIDIAQITQTFNTAFNDYFIPIEFTQQQLMDKFRAEGIQLELSAGAFDGERLVGFIFNGISTIKEKRIAWNGGTGVLSEYRGQNITKQLYAFLLPLLRNAGIGYTQLEVIAENAPARHIYSSIGFHELRNLIAWKGVPGQTVFNPAYKVNYEPLIKSKLILPDWGLHQPSWQNETTILLNWPERYTMLHIEQNNEAIGYAIFNPTNARIHQYGVHPLWRRKGIGAYLFHQVARQTGKEVSILNTDASDLISQSFFSGIGLHNNLNQIEMGMRI